MYGHKNQVGLPVAVGAIIVGAILGGGKVCGPYPSERRDPRTGENQPSMDFEVIPGDKQCPG